MDEDANPALFNAMRQQLDPSQPVMPSQYKMRGEPVNPMEAYHSYIADGMSKEEARLKVMEGLQMANKQVQAWNANRPVETDPSKEAYHTGGSSVPAYRQWAEEGEY